MKKIVGILSAAVVLAASVFAADVNAATKIAGSLFELTKDSAKEKGANEVKPDLTTTHLFTQNNDSHSYANPNITFSISDERAGATVKLTSDGGNKTVSLAEQTIWFKPFDFLKVTLGNYDVALNKEKIDWTESATGLGRQGYLASVNAGKVSFDFGLNAGAGAWLINSLSGKQSWGADVSNYEKPATLAAPVFAKIGYADSFGNIGVYAKVNKMGWVDGALKSYIEQTAQWKSMQSAEINAQKIYVPLDMDFGLGYANTFDPIAMFVNVAAHMDKITDATYQIHDKSKGNQDGYFVVNEGFKVMNRTNMWIRPELYASGNMGAFGFAAFVAPKFQRDSKDDLPANTAVYVDTLNVEVLAKVTYKLDKITPYLYGKVVTNNDKSVKKIGGAETSNEQSSFLTVVKLGATGSVGLMGWDICCKIDATTTQDYDEKKTDKFIVSIPFTASVSF